MGASSSAGKSEQVSREAKLENLPTAVVEQDVEEDHSLDEIEDVPANLTLREQISPCLYPAFAALVASDDRLDPDGIDAT